MANFYTLPQDVGASLSVPLGEDQGLCSRPLQLFHDRGYELRGEDTESVGPVCEHNYHENPEGCEVMSRKCTPREARGSILRDCNHLWRAEGARLGVRDRNGKGSA